MSYDNLDKMTINEDDYDGLCLKYGKARVDREIQLELESKEDAFNSFMSKRNKAIKDGTLGTMGASKVLKYGKARVDREIQLELESKEDAFNSFMSKRNKAIKDGTLGTMGASKVLISEAVPVLSKAITKWFEKVDNGRPGKRHILAGLAKELSPDELSFITLRTVLENAMGSVGLTSLGSKIGESVEDEVRYKTVVNSLDKKELGQFKTGLNKRIAMQFKRRYVIAKETLLADEKRLARCQLLRQEGARTV